MRDNPETTGAAPGADRPRHPHRARRLRHRLQRARLPRPPAAPPHQARQGLRPGPRQPGHRQADPRDHRARPRPGRRGHRRGRRAPEQLALVRRVGFTHAQGYATGAPVADPARSFADAAAEIQPQRPDAARLGRTARPAATAATIGAVRVTYRCGSAMANPMHDALSQSPRDPAFVQDPYPFYDRARALGPLFLWEDYGFPCAAGHAAVGALLRDRRFGRELPADLKPAAPGAPRRLLRARRPLDARPRAAGAHPPARPRAARLHLAPDRRRSARRSPRSPTR